MQPDAGAELLDVVDGNNRVIDTLPRAVVHRRGLRHRAVHILVLNPLGDLYVQRRAETKDCQPGLWDTSAAGHVDSGESYAHAAPRELAEELGIRVHALDVLFDLPASASTGAEFVRVYRCVTAAAPRPDPAEIAAGGWFAPAALAAWMRREPAVFTTAFRDIFARWTAAGGGMVSG